jgi:hypothetical protein
MITKITNTFIKKPSLLFLTDSIGAFTTSFLLFVVVRNLDTYFSMPDEIVVGLSAGAALLFVYSGTCFFFLKKNWTNYIRIIMIANLLYCILTGSLLFLWFYDLTTFDLMYFIGEINIIVFIVFIEYKTSRALS